MLDSTNTTINKVSVHHVGNKTTDEALNLSKTLLDISDEKVRELLFHYFLKSFTTQEYYSFTFSNGDVSLNAVYSFVSAIFENEKELHNQSKNIATQLYEIALHPQIKAGDLFVAYFSRIHIDGIETDAIGIFKSENRQAFLKVNNDDKEFVIESEDGINIEKLDKGCLIFNTDKENGYKVCVIDNTNKGSDAQYWKDDFLKVRPCNDNFHNTIDYLSLAKNFITKQLPNEFEVDKTTKIDLLNRSLQYFQDEDEFDEKDFKQKVMQDPEVIKSFDTFQKHYETTNDMEFSNTFEISDAAVKKQARVFKSVLKLDKNFHIYIHGDKSLIEQGREKDGRKYYKIYFEEEN